MQNLQSAVKMQVIIGKMKGKWLNSTTKTKTKKNEKTEKSVQRK